MSIKSDSSSFLWPKKWFQHLNLFNEAKPIIFGLYSDSFQQVINQDLSIYF